MKIGKIKISEKRPPFIVAEISANHNNSLSRTLKLIDAAKEAGADAIKIQTYKPETMTLNRYFIHAGLALLTSLFSCDQKKQSDTPETDTLKAPKWINKVGVEQNEFKEEVFYVNDYDAIADGSALTTTAIQKAIDAAAATGGGTVSFKPGNYLSGSIFIKENVHFTIPEGVELLGSEDIADYTEIDTRIAGVEMPWPAALINVLDQKNVTIDGDGLVDGQGKVFWDYYWNLRKEYEPKGLRWIVDYDAKRPRTLLIQNSENIILEDLNIQRAGFWTVQVLYSNHVTVDGLTIRNNIGGHGPSTDGIDIDSSKYILVQNCNIDCNRWISHVCNSR